METERDNNIKTISKESLDCIEGIAGSAEEELHNYKGPDATILATLNTWTDTNAVGGVRRIGDTAREALRELAREPVIARITLEREDGHRETIYITRGSPPTMPGVKIASYRSALGRIAALPAGDEAPIRMGGREQEALILDTTKLHPRRRDGLWDSQNSQIDSLRFGKLTVTSLRALGRPAGVPAEEDILAELLKEDALPTIVEGIRRDILRRMSLRDQPVLDKFQDEIFRLPLQSRCFLSGPPGTGKTTTLIRRLGQKLDRTALELSELALVARAERDDISHESSWIMFSPTELLRLYVKEAFVLEGVPASNERIRTWDDYRNEIARDHLGVLRTGTGSGHFVQRENDSYLSADCRGSNAARWYEAFEAYVHEQLDSELTSDREWLESSAKPELVQFAHRLGSVLSRFERRFNATAVPVMAALASQARELVEQRRQQAEKIVNKTVNRLLHENRQFLDRFAQEIARHSQEEDTEEDSGDDGEEDAPVWSRSVSREQALAIYRRTALAAARAKADRRRLASASRTGRLAAWLTTTRLPAAADLDELAVITAEQARLRRFNSVETLMPRSIPRLYKKFRRDKELAPAWYNNEPARPDDACWQEIDLLLLLLLRSCSAILASYGDGAEPPAGTIFSRVRGLYTSQVLVDEATDFSIIQLAIMRELAHPAIRSLFMCGDFNQRLTAWGITSRQDLAWIDPRIEFRAITTAYRQSAKLVALAKDVAAIGGSPGQDIVLPDRVDAEGVAPVWASNLGSVEQTAAWLADRILEVEAIVTAIPSIAVLVNDESEVEPLAAALGARLEDRNIKAAACKEGKVVGNDRDVRVFHVTHIKGMEFEAVFFVNLDQTIRSQPELFTKYLYVGSTRAATYLGITFSCDIPEEVSPLASHFCAGWPA
ncbi:ATP-binding domain-containing protein [Mesorhizobium australicum]|uniref:ATP-binding domain-containing protein n=1 Tax=Mesorhizobium australicum TaxID=536018 RepID=A0ACC6T0F5_9HYPH